MNDRLYRSRDDRMIGGVCGGLADRLDLDPSLVRVGWAILTILTGGALLVLYVILLFVVPEEPLGGVPPYPAAPPVPPPAAAPGEGAIPGWAPPTAAAAWTAPGATAAGAATGGPTAGGSTAEPTPSGDATSAAGIAPEQATEPASGWTAPNGWTSPQEARAARRAARRESRAHRDTTVGLILGLLLILLGAYFLLRQYVPNLDLDRVWPIVVIAFGVVLIARSFHRVEPPAA